MGYFDSIVKFDGDRFGMNMSKKTGTTPMGSFLLSSGDRVSSRILKSTRSSFVFMRERPFWNLIVEMLSINVPVHGGARESEAENEKEGSVLVLDSVTSSDSEISLDFDFVFLEMESVFVFLVRVTVSDTPISYEAEEENEVEAVLNDCWRVGVSATEVECVGSRVFVA